MGVLTELVIADKSEAETIAASFSPSEHWKGIDAKGHSEITLGLLLCVLRGEEFDEAIHEEFPLLAQASEEGPWIFETPNDLTVRLNRLDDSEIPSVASGWLTMGEDDLRGFDKDYAEGFIREFKLLAAESIARQKPVLMWMSL